MAVKALTARDKEIARKAAKKVMANKKKAKKRV